MAVIEEPVAALIALAQQCICTTFTDLCECCGHSGGNSLPPTAKCCECDEGFSGRSYLQVTRVYPVGSPFPAQSSNAAPCASVRMAVEFSVTIYRCVETINDQGVHPSCETTTEEMYRNLADMAQVRQAILCCLKEQADENASVKVLLIDQTPLDPTGGCGGTVSRFVATADAAILNSPALTVL